MDPLAVFFPIDSAMNINADLAEVRVNIQTVDISSQILQSPNIEHLQAAIKHGFVK